MALLSKFRPPGNMSDFDDVKTPAGAPSMSDQWSAFMSQCFDETIALEGMATPATYTVQYYNAMHEDPTPAVVQEIPWNAFPKELLRSYGRARALIEADALQPLTSYAAFFNGPDAATTLYRPLPEYCEWHVLRDADTGAIRRVTFTSEPPEYWQALAGDPVQTPNGTFQFRIADPKTKDKLLALYHELVSPDVVVDDLIAKKDIDLGDGGVVKAGQYNIYNKWNTSLGIAHLSAPPNSLAAEVQLGGDATVLRADGHGNLVVEPDALICCAAYGGPDRNSDPTIGSTVNALARLGAKITLRDPVGLYMDHIDTTGWSFPGGLKADDCIHYVRGDRANRMIERLVVELPKGSEFSVSDITIGGEPIRYGGQIAECITVKLVGVGAPLAGVHNTPVPCKGRCCVDPADLRRLNRAIGWHTTDDPPVPVPTPLGTVDAFAGEGTVRAPASPNAFVSFAAMAPPPSPPAPRHAHKRSLRAI